MRGCSTICGSHWSSRRRRRRCCASSPARPASWNQYSSPCWKTQYVSAKPCSEPCCCVRETASGASHCIMRRWNTRNTTKPSLFVVPPRRSPTLWETMQVDHVADMVVTDPQSPITRLGGAPTLLNVPMIREKELIGAIGIYRQEVRSFTEKQIALVQNFAAQAVIAIENARLLSELRQSLDRQTATADILRVVASTPEDSKRALDTIAETAAR